MTRSSSRKHNRTSASRAIAVLTISTSILLAGAVHGYATAKPGATDGTIFSPCTYAPHLLRGPLTPTSVDVAAEPTASDTVTVGVGFTHLHGPLK